MAGIGMVRCGRVIHIRDYVAAIRERDPQQCWAFQPSIDYNDYRLQESTREPITGSKVERTRKRKGKEVESRNPAATTASKVGRMKKRKGKEAESKNPAGNADNINNNLAFDVEEYSDDVTLGEFLRKQRTLKVNKNKKKQKAVQDEEASHSVAKSSLAGSCGGLGGLKPPGLVSGVQEPVVGVGGAKNKQKALEVEKATLFVAKPGSYGGLGGLKPPGSVSGVHEPVVGVPGAKNKQKALEVEKARLFVAKPAGSCGGVGGLKPSSSVSGVHEPVVGVVGAKKNQKALEVEKARLFVAKPVGSYGGLGGLKPASSVSGVHEPVVGVGGAKKKQKALEVEKARLCVAKPTGSSGGLGGLKPSGVHEPVVGVGGAKKKQKGFEVEGTRLFVAKPLHAGSSGGLGWLKPSGTVSRVYEPVVEVGKVQASEMALANPWYREVLVCSINRNPAEFSTETAKGFMRRIMS